VWFFPPLTPLGVGNNPDALSPVGGAGMESTHHERLSGVPKFFQIRHDSVSAESSEARYVLNNCEKGSGFSDDACVFGPKPGARSFDASPLAGGRNVLAREASCDCIHGNAI
jgi:hypothetical protein